MNRHFGWTQYLAAVAFLCWLLPGAAGARAGEYLLDVSHGTSLKALFDAGLRPTNVSGMETARCETGPCTLVFLGENGLRLRIEAESAEFNIAADESVTEIFAETRNTKLTEAVPEAERLFNLLGGLPDDFRAVIGKALSERSFEPLREMGPRGTGATGDPRIGAGFVPGDFVASAPHDLHVHLGLRLYWLGKAWHSRIRDEPIRPPQGYEHLSMAAAMTSFAGRGKPAPAPR